MGNHKSNIPHGTLSDYIRGLAWSILFTAISFGVVMTGAATGRLAIVVLLVSAGVQIFMQCVYFLHLKNTPDRTWDIVSGVFAIIQILIILLGTVWIMWHLLTNMQIGF